LFVVDKGSSFITEYKTTDLSSVRDISWTGGDYDPTMTHFKIYCAPEQLYVVDGASQPALFTVDGLDTANPTTTSQASLVKGVGGLAVSLDATNLYYWAQSGWNGGGSTAVHRLLASDFTSEDVTSSTVTQFSSEPYDAPIFLDEARGLIFVKNKIFDADELATLVYSLPSGYDVFNGAAENVYAYDGKHGTLATKNYIYELERYGLLETTLRADADQLFFDKHGILWFLSGARGTLEGQIVRR